MSASGAIIQGHEINASQSLTCDAVIVGSGSGGGVMADRLTAAGMDVIVLEEGGYFTNKDYTRDVHASLIRMYRDGGASLMVGNPSIAFSEGRCVGGSTVMNGGMTYRTPERVMSRWQYEAGLSWMNPKEMDPYFSWVEESIHAAHQHPDSIGLGDQMWKQAAESLGMTVTANKRNQKDCMGSNICILGCPDNRRQAVHITYIPRAVQRGARVYSDCLVRRILARGSTACGVVADVIDRNTKAKRHEISVRAKIVILAGGAIQTPALLQRNKMAGKRVGKNLTVHPNIKMVGLMDREIFYWKGNHQTHKVLDYLDEGIMLATAGIPPAMAGMTLVQYGADSLRIMEQFNRMYVTGCLVDDTTTGSVKAYPKDVVITRYQVDAVAVQRMKRAACLLAEILFEMGATSILTGFATLPEITKREQIPQIYSHSIRPADIEIMTVHMMGTASMGTDPRRSAVQPTGEMWDLRNLFVCDASLFPTSIAVNPQVTIQALSARVADQIIGNKAKFWSQAA